jgi:hypothetical protein
MVSESAPTSPRHSVLALLLGFFHLAPISTDFSSPLFPLLLTGYALGSSPFPIPYTPNLARV